MENRRTRCLFLPVNIVSALGEKNAMKFPKEELKLLCDSEKNRNRIRDLLLICAITTSICITTLILSLLYGKYTLDKQRYEQISGKTIFTSIENASPETKRAAESLSYVRSVQTEYENGKLMMNGLHYASCTTTDSETFFRVYAPAFSSVNGSFPRNTDEIMLSRHTLSKLGIYQPAPGMKLNLEFYWDQLKYTRLTGQQGFTLSGFYETTEDETVLSKAFISVRRMQTADIPLTPFRLLIDTEKPWWSKAYTQERLGQDIPLTDKQRLVCETSASFKAIETSGGNLYLAYFLLLCVILCTHLIIYNIISISSVKDLENYELLRAVGASRRQLRAVLFRRMRSIWMTGCLISGFICLFIQTVFIFIARGKNYYDTWYLERNTFDIPLRVFVVTSILSGFILFASAFSVYRKSVHKKNLNKKHFNKRPDRGRPNGILSVQGRAFKKRKEKEILFRLALNRLFRSRRSTLFSIVLLFLGCEISLIGTIVISGMDPTKSLMQNPDFTVEIPMNTVKYLSESATDNDELAQISGDPLLELKQLTSEMTTDFRLTQVYLVIPHNDNGVSNFQVLEAENLPILLYEDTAYIDRLLEYAERNSLPINEEIFRQENGVIILHENSFAAGEAERLYRYETENRPIHISSIVPVGTDMESIPVYPLYNCGFLDITATGFPQLNVPWKGQNNIYLLARKELFDTFRERLKKQYIRAEIYADENKIDLTEHTINTWIKHQNQTLRSETGNSGVDHFVYTANRDVIAQMKSYISAGRVMVCTIVALLLFIGLGIYFITTATNTIVYHSELNLLNTLGITKTSLSKILFYEGMIYAVAVLFLWLSIGNLLVVPIVQICSRYDSFSYHYPFPLAVGIIFGLLAIGRISPLIWKFLK